MNHDTFALKYGKKNAKSHRTRLVPIRRDREAVLAMVRGIEAGNKPPASRTKSTCGTGQFRKSVFKSTAGTGSIYEFKHCPELANLFTL